MSQLVFHSGLAEILGQEVPLETIKDWAANGNWTAQLKFSWNQTEELRQTRRLLDVAKDRVMDPDTSIREVANAARAYRMLVRKCPVGMRSLLEDEAILIRGELFKILDETPDLASAQLASITGVWTDLGALVATQIVSAEDGTESYDALILSQRSRPLDAAG